MSKNSAKIKQYYYFHAEFLEEIRYVGCMLLPPSPPDDTTTSAGSVLGSYFCVLRIVYVCLVVVPVVLDMCYTCAN